MLMLYIYTYDTVDNKLFVSLYRISLRIMQIKFQIKELIVKLYIYFTKLSSRIANVTTHEYFSRFRDPGSYCARESSPHIGNCSQRQGSNCSSIC